MRSYHPADTQEVEIAATYSGFPANEQDTPRLRTILEGKTRDVFFKGSLAGPDAVLDVRSLSRLLGNAGNNQVANRETGLAGPIFELERVAVAELNGRQVLRVWGWFHSTDQVPQNFYAGLFIDASPDDNTARLEELHLQTYTKELFQAYDPLFEELLGTITW